MMRSVVFLINSLEGGGAERVLTYLVNNMAEWDIHLVLLDDKPIAYELSENIKLHVLGRPNFVLASFVFSRWLKKNAQNAIVVSFLNRSNYVNILSKLFHQHVAFLSERNTVSMHFSGNNLYGLLNRIIVKKIYKFSAGIIAVSSGVKNDLVLSFGCRPENVQVINNPVDYEKALRLAEREETFVKDYGNYVCAVGRLTKQKRFDLLIEAFSFVTPDLNLVILGDGEECGKLQKMIVNSGQEERIQLVGFKKNPYPYIKNAEMFVLSSDYEGFPNVLLEALALGKAVVATDCPSGPCDILGADEEFGLLVPPGNAQQIAKAINRLHSDIAMRKHYEDKAKERIADYSLGKVVGMYKTSITCMSRTKVGGG